MIDRTLLLSTSAPVDITSKDGQLIILGREILRLRERLASIRNISTTPGYVGIRHGHAFVDACILNSMFCETMFQAGVALNPGPAYEPGGAPVWDQGDSCSMAAAILGADLFQVPALPPAPPLRAGDIILRAVSQQEAEARDAAERDHHDPRPQEQRIARVRRRIVATEAAAAAAGEYRAYWFLAACYGLSMAIAAVAIGWPGHLHAAWAAIAGASWLWGR